MSLSCQRRLASSVVRVPLGSQAHAAWHDLRAKSASDATTLEHARQLLSHADSRITEKVYRRKPEFINPLR